MCHAGMWGGVEVIVPCTSTEVQDEGEWSGSCPSADGSLWTDRNSALFYHFAPMI